MTDWRQHIRFFSPGGDPALNDPDGTRIDLNTMLLLDAMREEAGIPFSVTDGARSDADQERLLQERLTEAKTSAHALVPCRAVDGRFDGLPLTAQFALACRWGWKGIGLYPYTRNADGMVGKPILHLDTMDRGRPRAALWIRNRAGVYVYAPTREFLHELQMLVASERWER